MKNVCIFLLLVFSSLTLSSLTFAQSYPIKLINSTPSQSLRSQLESLHDQIFSYLDEQTEKPVSFRYAGTSRRIVPAQSFSHFYKSSYAIPTYSNMDKIVDFEYLEYDYDKYFDRHIWFNIPYTEWAR